MTRNPKKIEMLKGYKYRLYPTSDQKQKIDQSINGCRVVYNLALETKIWAYKAYGVKLSAFDLCRQLVDLRKAFPWIKAIDSQALYASVKKMDVSFINFFRGKGYPKFKSKRGIQSFQCPNHKREVDWEKSTLTVPKIKDIPIRLSRRFEGKIKIITISKTTTGKYFASIIVDTITEKVPKSPIKNAVGIDLGLNHFIITDSGIKIDNQRYLRESIIRLKVLQRRASKRKDGSKNKKKANLRVAILNERISNQRLDFIHKVTSTLVSDSQTDTFVIEDLNVKGMILNHKLAQAISDVSWGKFKEILKYKCSWYGKNLIIISRFAPTSKTCSNCKHIKDDLSLADRIYSCSNCGHVIDRDINAAINIKNFGLCQSGWGTSVEPVESPSIEGSLKQETNINATPSYL